MTQENEKELINALKQIANYLGQITWTITHTKR